MGQDVSIAFKASDNLTNCLRQMRRSVDGLSRDVSEYRKIQDQAFGKRSEIKLDITQAKKELKELEQLIKAGDKEAEKSYKEKQRQLELLSEEYRRLGNVVREAGRAEKRLHDDISRTSNAAASRTPDLIRSLAGAGLGNMLGGAVAGNASQLANSLWGNTAGSAVSGIVSGTFSGAAMGSIAGPIGSAVGAAVGGLTGAIQALTAAQQKRDDFFREDVQGLFAQVKQEQGQGLASGIEYESNREKNVSALKTLLGSQDKADKMYQDIKDFGTNTPYQASSILNSAKQMLAYGISEDQIMSNTNMLGEVAMGDQAKFDSLSYAYAQIQSAGVLRGQDLLQLTAAGFNPLSVLAEEQGRTLSEMQEQMSKGLVSAEDVTHAFQMATQEGGKYFGAMAEQMETYAGKMSMLNDIKADIEGGYGEGYTAKRKEGLDREIEQMQGEIGTQMKEAYSLIGEFQADLENRHQQTIIDAINAAKETEDYQKAQAEGNGAEMGRIMAEARAKAEMDYKNSEEYGLLQQSDLALVDKLQEDAALNGAYMEYGRKMGAAFEKGWSGAINGLVREGKLTIDEEIRMQKQHGGLFGFIGGSLAEANMANANAVRTNLGVGVYATGLNRVPYNNMPALLHEGERVLTKQEANRMDRGVQGVQIAKLADSIIVREEADIDRIARALCDKLSKAGENFAGG